MKFNDTNPNVFLRKKIIVSMCDVKRLSCRYQEQRALQMQGKLHPLLSNYRNLMLQAAKTAHNEAFIAMHIGYLSFASYKRVNAWLDQVAGTHYC